MIRNPISRHVSCLPQLPSLFLLSHFPRSQTPLGKQKTAVTTSVKAVQYTTAIKASMVPAIRVTAAEFFRGHDAAAPSGNEMSWWDEIDGSADWQRGLFFTLCASYAAVSLIALVQLIRIQWRVPEYGWTTQKIFHLMNFVVNGLRAVLFGFYNSVFLIESKALEMALLDLPGLLFFSTYTLLVLFWAEIYYQAKNLPSGELRPTYLKINAAIYIIQMCIWIYVQADPRPIPVEIAKLFLAVVSFFAALGFLNIGGNLFELLRQFPIESNGRRKKLNEVGCVTGICSTCFLIRTVVVCLSAFDKDADLDVLEHPILNFIYYMLVEILPSALVLFILRKLPPKRVSDQYHPIK